MRRQSAGVVAAVCLSILSGACAHRMAKPTQTGVRPESAPPQGSSLEASNSEPSLRGDLMRSIPELKTVHFDFDSSFLGSDERAVLAANARWLKENDGVRVQVSGNCDQRGTVEYNLALGQRRAAAVRDYYRLLGVAADRVGTISYGREKPLCQEADEACWQKNRRAETLAASPGVARTTQVDRGAKR